ncbi:MAG: LPP20 family lipoprotein [Gammaproteobacteria bacterium]|nr:LPP20 family lipoprotein [Gammaproteobacteria bacterium]
MYIIIIFLKVLMLTCIAACANLSAERPSWLDDPNSVYPQAEYLSASGSADTAEKAKDRAMANTAKIFSVTISSASRDVLQVQQNTDINNKTESVERSAQMFTNSIAAQTMEGVNIAREWRDPKTQEYYALAIISRAQAANKLRAALRGIDEALEDLARRANASAQPLEKARLYNAMLKLMPDREALQEKMRIVNLQGLAYPAEYTVNALENQRRLALEQVVVSIAVTEAAMAYKSNLEAGLNALGVKLAPTAALQVSLDIKMEPITQKDGWYWLRGEVVLSLNENAVTINRIAEPFKVPATTKEEAMVRGLRKADEVISLRLNEVLLN